MITGRRELHYDPGNPPKFLKLKLLISVKKIEDFPKTNLIPGESNNFDYNLMPLAVRNVITIFFELAWRTHHFHHVSSCGRHGSSVKVVSVDDKLLVCFANPGTASDVVRAVRSTQGAVHHILIAIVACVWYLNQNI